MVDQATVISTDINASNWVAHVIDSLLLPASVRADLWLPAFDGTISDGDDDDMDDDMDDNTDMDNSMNMEVTPTALPNTWVSREALGL